MTNSPPPLTAPSPTTPTSTPQHPGGRQFEDNHSIPTLIGLGYVGGLLMGVANIVPGISGGAMLLLVGVYAAFLTGIANIVGLKWQTRAFIAVGAVGFGALTSIFLLAGPVKDLIVNYRWQSFAFLIGMRVGIIPSIWRMAKPATRSLWIGFAVGLLLTGVAALLNYRPDLRGQLDTPPWMFFGGLLSASATVLPGLDGSYLLILLGQYTEILGLVDELKNNLVQQRDLAAAFATGLKILPFAIGAAIGIGGVSLLLKTLFEKYAKPTFGLLLGVLCGAFIGLYPFAKYLPIEVGQKLPKGGGGLVTPENIGRFEPDDGLLVFFAPTITQTLLAVAFILAGILAAYLLSLTDPENRRKGREGAEGPGGTGGAAGQPDRAPQPNG